MEGLESQVPPMGSGSRVPGEGSGSRVLRMGSGSHFSGMPNETQIEKISIKLLIT